MLQARKRFMRTSQIAFVGICGWLGLSACDSPQSWGPAGRMVKFASPQTPLAAREAGCFSYGLNLGAGVDSLALLSGGIDQYYTADRHGEIHIVTLAQAYGWQKDLSPQEQEFDLRLYRGEQDEKQRFRVALPSFVGNDPDNEPVSVFRHLHISDDGWVEGDSDSIEWTIPVLDDYVVYLKLRANILSGAMSVDGKGLHFSGNITGYFTRDDIVQGINQMLDRCYKDPQPHKPRICRATAGFITPETSDEEKVRLFAQVVGGLDTMFENGTPSFCENPAECNAVSACFLVDLEGVKIAGIGK